MELLDFGAVGAMLAVILALIEVVKAQAKKRNGDGDGLELVGVLRQISDSQSDISENLKEVSMRLVQMQTLQNEMRSTQKELGSAIYSTREIVRNSN